MSVFLIRILLPLAFCAVLVCSSGPPSSGCAPSGRQPKHVLGALTALDLTTQEPLVRLAWIYLPSAYSTNEPAPLIFAFHGKGQTVEEFRKQTELTNETYNRKSIVVFPEGINEQWTGDPSSPPTTSINDLLFVQELIDQLESSYCLDRSRIYAAGFSNGGGLTALLACHPFLSRRIAAFAAASGAYYKGAALPQPLFDYCSPGRRPVPFLDFHGTHDDVIDYEGVGTPDGETYQIPAYVTAWAERNGCDVDRGNKSLRLNAGAVFRYTYDCDLASPNIGLVEHYKLVGGSHTWPRLDVGPPSPEDDEQRDSFFDATALVLDFFSEHALPEDVLLEAPSSEPASLVADVEGPTVMSTSTAYDTRTVRKVVDVLESSTMAVKDDPIKDEL